MMHLMTMIDIAIARRYLRPYRYPPCILLLRVMIDLRRSLSMIGMALVKLYLAIPSQRFLVLSSGVRRVFFLEPAFNPSVQSPRHRLRTSFKP
jgi:hypothetical protein